MNIPVYRGQLRQRGYGLGGVLKSAASSVVPYLIDSGKTPLLNELSGGYTDLMLNPGSFKSVAKKRALSFGKSMGKQLWRDKEHLISLATGKKPKPISADDLLAAATAASGSINDEPMDTEDQLGSGRRRYKRRKSKPRRKKRKLDYLD